MRPVFVVVRQVLVEHGEQVASVGDQDAVQALPACGAYESDGYYSRWGESVVAVARR